MNFLVEPYLLVGPIIDLSNLVPQFIQAAKKTGTHYRNDSKDWDQRGGSLPLSPLPSLPRFPLPTSLSFLPLLQTMSSQTVNRTSQPASSFPSRVRRLTKWVVATRSWTIGDCAGLFEKPLQRWEMTAVSRPPLTPSPIISAISALQGMTPGHQVLSVKMWRVSIQNPFQVGLNFCGESN